MIREVLTPIVFILLGFALHSCEGLHCWECNSKYDPNCGDPFKNTTIALADCNQRHLPNNMTAEATICRKITQTVQSETRVIRSCGFFNPEEAGTCMSRAGTHLVFMHYCQCAGEGCNGSSLPLSTPLLTLLLFCIAAIFS